VAPSPIQAEAILVSPLMAEAMPQPTAWMNCVARLPLMEKKPARLYEYITGSWRPEQRVALVAHQLADQLGQRDVVAREQQALLAVGGKAHVARRSASACATAMASSPRHCM
jgi:hypothetical protein